MKSTIVQKKLLGFFQKSHLHFSRIDLQVEVGIKIIGLATLGSSTYPNVTYHPEIAGLVKGVINHWFARPAKKNLISGGWGSLRVGRLTRHDLSESRRLGV